MASEPQESTTVQLFSLEELVGRPLNEYDQIESSFHLNGLMITTWLWKRKNFDSNAKLNSPIVAIHGGPAFCHNYILPLILLCDYGYPVIFYDQAGCGKSTFVENVTETAPHLLTVEYYVQELMAVIDHYSLDKYFIYGSSWGTMVAQEYAITQPQSQLTNLLGLVLDGALCDTQLYESTQWRDIISKYPLRTQELFKRLIAEKQFDSPTMEVIDDALSAQFTSRLLPAAQIYEDSLAGFNNDIYCRMQGPSEFCSADSVLEHWTVTDKLHMITVPTLVLRGEFDSMTEECSQALVDHIPSARPLVTIARAAHCKLIDEPEQCAEVIRTFLDSIIV